MGMWEKISEWFWGVGTCIVVVSIIGGIIVLGYTCHKEFESQYDYKVKVMDSKEGTTYYVKKDNIEIVDGILFIKPNNITTTTFTITPIDKD
jgi:hypothetical protein